ncbi:hypothetical protein FRB99_007526 [Tulasnella sp. 403]|nr:hypothetical protein FRB99_007526 [Tulasnella sp. 403]
MALSTRLHARVRPFIRTLLCRRAFSTTSRLQSPGDFIKGVDDGDMLEISRFGDYSLVLPEDPMREGVDHIIPQTVPKHIRRPPYAIFNGAMAKLSVDELDFREVSLTEKLQRMRRAGTIARDALDCVGKAIKPGLTTRDLNDIVHNIIISNNAYPSPLLYKGYPMSCCTSVNNILVHGIPDDRPLENGDIVNVDVTVYKDGYHGDTSRTFLVGEVDEQGRDLVQTVVEALVSAISVCGPGVPYREIGRVIESLARKRGCSVSAEVLGHGIGRLFHQAPQIYHIENDDKGLMAVGDVFTIEPAIVQGEDARGWMLPDGWTVLTESGARAAQAEHTIAITSEGPEVLTK